MKKQTDFASKPYNRCLSCPHLRVRCDGPRTSGLPLPRWKELMRDMKELFELTYADIAEEAHLPVKTVERALSPSSTQDIMRDTAMAIENAIVGSTSNSPCILAFEEENGTNQQRFGEVMKELDRLMADNKEYKDIQQRIHDSYHEEIVAVRAESQNLNGFLMEQLVHLRNENNNLWAENNRKSKIVDMFLSNHSYQFVNKEE